MIIIPVIDIATHSPNAIDTGILPAPTSVKTKSNTTNASKVSVTILSTFSNFNLSPSAFLDFYRDYFFEYIGIMFSS